MANPPPPYDDITGISRTVMKDNAQESIVNYNGNARPGEIVVDLTTNPPTPYIGNNIGQLTLLTSAGTYGNIQVGQYLEAAQVGNIIPSGNAVYTLGNATNQWSDLYVSNATIYMNNVPISLTAGNTLTVNGQAILSNNSNATVSTTGNVSASYFVGNGSLLTGISGGGANLGNLAIDDYNIYNSTGSQGVIISNFSFIAEAETAYLQIPAGNSTSDLNLVQEQGNVRLVANAAAWTFNTNGTLTVPGDITSTDSFAIDSGNDLSISGGNQLPDSAVGEGGDVTIFGGTGRIDNGTSTGSGGDVRINAGDGGDGVTSGAGAGGYAEVQGGSGGAANVVNNVQAGEGGYVVIQGGQGGDNLGNLALSGLGGNVEIYGGTGSADGGNSTISGAAGHVNLYGGNWGFAGLATGNIYLNTYDGTNFKTLTYDSVGNVTMAPGGGLNFVGSNPGITSGLNQDFYIRASDDESDGWSIFNVVDDGAGNILAQTRLEFDQYTVRTDAQGAGYTWAFRDTGVLDLPGDIYGNVGGNLIIKIGDQPGSDTFIDLQTRSYVGDALISNIRIANPNVTVSTASGAYNWTFDGTGNLNLPPSGNLVGTTANNSGHINWLGNSSGDGYGYTTMKLVPDDTVNDSYLILDPTAPNHIHIRAGGTQDNSGSQLYLGGENSYFKVDNGLNPNVYVTANSKVWTFGTDSNITLPSGTPAIQTPDQTGTITLKVQGGVTEQSLLELGSDGGNDQFVYISTQDNSGNRATFDMGAYAGTPAYAQIQTYDGVSVTQNWLFTTAPLDPTEAYLYVPGGASITTPNATGGAGGKNIFIEAGAADQSTYSTSAGGELMLKGGRGAFNDGGGGGPGGNVNINAGESADPAGHAGNVYITAGALQSWVFDYTGVLTAPKSVIITPVAYSSLTATAGARAFVNNANLVAAGNFGSQISGGGANTVPVWSDGTNWYIG